MLPLCVQERTITISCPPCGMPNPTLSLSLYIYIYILSIYILYICIWLFFMCATDTYICVCARVYIHIIHIHTYMYIHMSLNVRRMYHRRLHPYVYYGLVFGVLRERWILRSIAQGSPAKLEDLRAKRNATLGPSALSQTEKVKSHTSEGDALNTTTAPNSS
jgi:hypothetical protein